MPQTYFVCDPGNLCEGAQCCTSLETQPELTVGDYLRLSDYTGEPIVDIWRNDGTVSLASAKRGNPTEFLMSLGLLHDPCPYLTEEFKCQVYESRPSTCGLFPNPLLLNPATRQEQYKSYKCLQNVELSDEQAKFRDALYQIFREEVATEEKYFWSLGSRYISVPDYGVYFNLAEKATDFQSNRDPFKTSQRSKRLFAAIDKVMNLLESGEESKGLQADVFTDMLSPVMYAILEDEIAQKFEHLDECTLKFYRDTSSRIRKLLRRQPLVQIQ